MFLQMRYALKKQRLVPHRDVIEQHQMLMDLSHIPDVRHNRQIEFPS